MENYNNGQNQNDSDPARKNYNQLNTIDIETVEDSWENNKPGATTEEEFNIPTVTPDNDNGIAGPYDLIDDTHNSGVLDSEGTGPDEDDDDEELIPIETDHDEESLDIDEDEIDDADDFDPLERPTTF